MDLARYPLEAEAVGGLLDRLTEECSEVIQAVSKLRRFGAGGCGPGGVTNAAKLEAEMVDAETVFAAVRARRITNARVADWVDAAGAIADGACRAEAPLPGCSVCGGSGLDERRANEPVAGPGGPDRRGPEQCVCTAPKAWLVAELQRLANVSTTQRLVTDASMADGS